MSLQGSLSPPVPGQQFASFQIISQIGVGAVGAVYRARWPDVGKEVAVKVLLRELAGNELILKRFLREAQAMARLNHENIVQLHAVGEHDGQHYLVMEFVAGIDALRYLRKKGPLSVTEALEISRQAALALQHAHEQGIVHRDVKPSNLLLTKKDGRPLVKLTDFGLGRDLQNQDESHLTRMGAAVGTVDYMAPEQARGSHLADIRSDLYSLGCTLYHMLTGRTPFPQGEFLEKLYKHVHVMPADPRDFTPDLPDDVIRLLGKLLAKRPEDRIQTPAEVVREIERIQASERPYVLAMAAEEESVARPESSTGVTAADSAPPVAPVAQFDGSSSDGLFSTEQAVRPRPRTLLLAGLALLAVLVLILYVLLS